jgi:hypothetical protein
MNKTKCGGRQAQSCRIHGTSRHVILPIHTLYVSQSLNVILLQKNLRNAPDLSIYSLLVKKVSGFSSRRLGEVVLPRVRTMDQDASNSNASQDEPRILTG